MHESVSAFIASLNWRQLVTCNYLLLISAQFANSYVWYIIYVYSFKTLYPGFTDFFLVEYHKFRALAISTSKLYIVCCVLVVRIVPASPWGPGGPGSPSRPSRPAGVWTHPLSVSSPLWRACRGVMGPAAMGL